MRLPLRQAFRLGASRALRSADSNHPGGDRLNNLRKIDANRIEHLHVTRAARGRAASRYFNNSHPPGGDRAVKLRLP
jgi:hypothetical protein